MNLSDIEKQCYFYQRMRMVAKEKHLIEKTLSKPEFVNWVWGVERLKQLDPNSSYLNFIKPLVDFSIPLFTGTKKIAFCFATYEDISQIEIWTKFFEQAHPDQYVILTHAKWPNEVTQNFVKSHLIPEYFTSSWGNINVMRLTLKMFEYAFQDTQVYKQLICHNLVFP